MLSSCPDDRRPVSLTGVASKWTEAEAGFMGKDCVAAAGEAVTGPSAALRPVSRAHRGLRGAPACPELGGRGIRE